MLISLRSWPAMLTSCHGRCDMTWKATRCKSALVAAAPQHRPRARLRARLKACWHDKTIFLTWNQWAHARGRQVTPGFNIQVQADLSTAGQDGNLQQTVQLLGGEWSTTAIPAISIHNNSGLLWVSWGRASGACCVVQQPVQKATLCYTCAFHQAPTIWNSSAESHSRKQ
jgi:hypothetical protein